MPIPRHPDEISDLGDGPGQSDPRPTLPIVVDVSVHGPQGKRTGRVWNEQSPGAGLRRRIIRKPDRCRTARRQKGMGQLPLEPQSRREEAPIWERSAVIRRGHSLAGSAASWAMTELEFMRW